MTAVKKAVESASSLILEEFLTICATELSAGDAKKPEEIVSMLRRFG
jgi:DNA-binding FrmR family transcriptional regulator